MLLYVVDCVAQSAHIILNSKVSLTIFKNYSRVPKDEIIVYNLKSPFLFSQFVYAISGIFV